MYEPRLFILKITPIIKKHLAETDHLAVDLAQQFDHLLTIIENQFNQHSSFEILKIKNDKNYDYYYQISYSASDISDEICLYTIDAIYELFWLAVMGEGAGKISGDMTACLQKFGDTLATKKIEVYPPGFIYSIMPVLNRLTGIIETCRAKLRVSLVRCWRPINWGAMMADSDGTFAAVSNDPASNNDKGPKEEQPSLFYPPANRTLPEDINILSTKPSALAEPETLEVEFDIREIRGQFVVIVLLNGYRINCKLSIATHEKCLRMIKASCAGKFILTYDPTKEPYYVMDLERIE